MHVPFRSVGKLDTTPMGALVVPTLVFQTVNELYFKLLPPVTYVSTIGDREYLGHTE